LNPYDQTPWQGESCPTSHPDSVGAIARLFGLASAPVEACRVLELGCAAGANLLPMAAALPGSTFVGVDLSEGQVAAGRAEAQAAGLSNLSFRAADLASFPTDLGTFDYVIAHGVYSWVPPQAQDGLLRGVRTCLAPEGVAYVSYDALPGAYPRKALREMLSWQVRGEADPAARVERARRFAELVVLHAEPRVPHLAAMRRLVGELGGMSDAHLLHEYLSENYEPLTLSAFLARADARGLQYVADAQFHTMFSDGLAAEAGEAIRGDAPDQAAVEQAMDFFVHRPFRTSLLCHRERTVDRALSWERIEGLFVASRAQREDRPGVGWSFRTPAGESFGTDSPLVGEALESLTQAWPRPTAFSALCDGTTRGREAMGSNLLAAFAANQLHLGLSDRGIPARAADRPRALASARAQASRGGRFATDLWHQTVVLEPWQKALLPLCDGTRSRPELGAALAEKGHSGGPEALDEKLAALAALALLVA
jgi:predicted O-methyltransferase YrrM